MRAMNEERRKLLKKMGRRLRELRLAKGMSQEQLAKCAETEHNYVSKIERGERKK